MKYGNWKTNIIDGEKLELMGREGISPLLAAALCARGLDTPGKAAAFLKGGELHDPFLLTDMDKAVQNINKAVSEGRKILIYGDYDVDGITATCLLTEHLRLRGADCGWYIPGRLEEGYGLNKDALEKIKAEGYDLIISVDCGITAVEEAEFAADLGIGMVITDHHEPQAELPRTLALINPHREGDGYPFKQLAGVGVAFKLVCALEGKGSEDRLLDRYGDLLALGTVADVMPLTDENRSFVKKGLKSLSRARRVGIKKLIAEAGMSGKEISASTLSYSLAPRINAAGRMERVELAVELLLTKDELLAENYAKELCDLNRRRQEVEAEIFDEAVRMLNACPQQGAIVLAGEGWHQGVIGIVASRLAESYGMPAALICLEDGIGKASSRSYGCFNIFKALSEQGGLLESYGGHALAAGFVVKEENIPRLKEGLSGAAEGFFGSGEAEPVLELDCFIESAKLLSLRNVQDLAALEPCGSENRSPAFALRNVKIDGLSPIGGGKHLRLKFAAEGLSLDGVFFGQTQISCGILEGDRVDLAFSPQINEFRGKKSVQLLLRDMRPAEDVLSSRQSQRSAFLRYFQGQSVSAEERADMLPTRKDFVAVWKFLRAHASDDRFTDNVNCFSRRVSRAGGHFCSEPKAGVCLEVFKEFALIDYKIHKEEIHIKIKNVSQKVDLGDSEILADLEGRGKEALIDGGY